MTTTGGYTKYGKGFQIPPLKGLVDVSQIFASMKPEALREAKTAQKGPRTRLARSLTSAVEAGQPLLWGVQLGLVREEGLPQTLGGHMRLLIGYNTAKNEVIYTDSWGGRDTN